MSNLDRVPLYDYEEEYDAQAEAQAIIDAVERCARGEHEPEPVDVGDDNSNAMQCAFCRCRL